MIVAHHKLHSIVKHCSRYLHLLNVTNLSCQYIISKNMMSDMPPIFSEGQAKILPTEKVFYNPVQEFNRDISIAVLRTFMEDVKNKPSKNIVSDNKNINANVFETAAKKITILEALSATGLRSIRYAKEIPSVAKIVANDLSEKAVENIKRNVEYNNVQNLIETSHKDATLLMYQHRKPSDRFTAVDLDPYGCPSMFLDSAVQCTEDGGLLLITATDMAVLAGNSPETCYSKYGATSLRWKACHEQALRILLQCIESHANRYGRYIVPLLSISVDFYIRTFVRIHTSPSHCKKSLSKLSMVYQCVGCETFTLQPLGEFKNMPTEKDPGRVRPVLCRAPTVSHNCEHCGWEHVIGGPVWTGPLHDINFVNNVLTLVAQEKESFATSKRMEGILTMITEELQDVPFYYTTEKLFSVLHVESMPMLILRSAIMNSGYRVSFSHACKGSIKTDAPAKVIWDILRSWERTHPVKEKRMEGDSPAKVILSKEITSPVDLTERKDANPISRRGGYVRFQYNPQPYWGPGTRATAMTGEQRMSKSRKNQNKKSCNKRERSESSAEDTKHPKIDETLPQLATTGSRAMRPHCVSKHETNDDSSGAFIMVTFVVEQGGVSSVSY